MIERKHARARRFLRSLLIAGAGAAAWVALSATAANADSGSTDHGSLLGGVKSTVAAASHGLFGGGGLQGGGAESNRPGNAAASLPAPANPVLANSVPANLVSVPQVPVPQTSAPQLPVPAVVEVLDDAVEVVPLVESVAPAPPVSDVVSGVTEPVTSTIHEVVAVLPPPLAAGLQPVAETADEAVTEVLQPVTGTVIEVLDLGQVPDPGRLVDLLDLAAAAHPSILRDSSLGHSAQGLPPSVAFIDVPADMAALQSDLALTGGAAEYTRARAPSSSSLVGPGRAPSPHPEMPVVYGVASGHAAGDSSSASAAWLHSIFDFSVRPWVALGIPAGEQHPSPVSFDPGSSPD